MRKKYDARKVQSYRSYTIADLCRVYSAQKLHPQTVRGWIKIGRLEAMTHGRAVFVYGAIWKQFIRKQNKKSKHILKFRELKCFKCKVIGEPADNTIHGVRLAASKCLVAIVVCQKCGHLNQRKYKRIEHQKLHDTFIVLHDEVPQLCDSSNTPCKTHMEKGANKPASESHGRKQDNSANPSCKTHILHQQTSLFDFI